MSIARSTLAAAATAARAERLRLASSEFANRSRWATLLGTRYIGAGKGEAFGMRNAVPGEYPERARSTQVTARAAIAD